MKHMAEKKLGLHKNGIFNLIFHGPNLLRQFNFLNGSLFYGTLVKWRNAVKYSSQQIKESFMWTFGWSA